MSRHSSTAWLGFTLIELLSALLVFSLLALMSYRGLGVVLDTRAQLKQEADKWRRIEAFLTRFEQDVRLAAPREVRAASGSVAAWRGLPPVAGRPGLEFSRFASAEGTDSVRRIAYRLNEREEIELSLWSGLDAAPGAQPERHTVLAGISALELQYLSSDLAWVDGWPNSPGDAPFPRAVRIRIVIAPDEEIVRVFGLRS